MTEIVTASQAHLSSPRLSDDCLTVVLNGLKSEKSKDNYATNARLFNSWLARHNRAVSIDSVISYVATLESEGKKPATINSRLATIRAVVKVAKRKKLIAPHEADGIIAIKSRKSDSNENAVWLERDQITEILNQLVKGCTNKDKRDACLFALGIATGLRRDELLSLDWSQLKQLNKKNYLVNVKTKGSKIRKVIIQKWAMKHVNAWANVTGRRGLIFVRFMSRKGERFTENAVKSVAFGKIVSRLGKMIEVDLKPHDLRRTHAAMMYDAGKSPREIQASLGHSSVVTTEKYLKPIQADRNADDEAFII